MLPHQIIEHMGVWQPGRSLRWSIRLTCLTTETARRLGQGNRVPRRPDAQRNPAGYQPHAETDPC